MSGVNLQAIYNRLRSVPAYHPMSANTYADWSMEAGDMITVSRNGTAYKSPVGSSTVKWTGKQQVQIQSEGSRERDPISRVSARKYATGGGGTSGIRANQSLYYEMFGEDGQLHAVISATAESLTSDYSKKIEDTGIELRGVITQTAESLTSDYTKKFTEQNVELRGVIRQTAESLTSDYSMKIGDVDSALRGVITQTAESLTSDYSNKIAETESHIEQTAERISLEVDDVKEGLESEIEIERGRIGLVVSGTGENAKIKPASIVASINNATKESSVLISADRVSLSGTTTIDNAMTVQNGNLLVKYAALFGTTAGNQVSINNGSVNAKTLQVNSGGKLTLVGSGAGEHYDITTSVLQGVIKNASVSGNVLTLTPFYGDAITFSKATSLSGAWSSVGGVNKYRVTAKQNGVAVATHDYDPPMRLNGTTAASNFSAEVTQTSGSTTTGMKSIYGYLVKGGSGSSSYVDVNTAYDGTGTSVARLGIGSVYTAGQNNVTITKGAWASGKIDFTKSAGTSSTKSVSLVAGTPTADESTVSIEIWDGDSADVQHGSKTGCTAKASLQTKSVTSNGDVTPDTNSGYVGLSKVSVNVSASVGGAWSGGVYTVTANPGSKKKSIGFGSSADVQLSISHGSASVFTDTLGNENKDFLSIPTYAESVGDGAGGGNTNRYSTTPAISIASMREALSVTSNGTYTPGTGKVGFSSVVVNVPSSSGGSDASQIQIDSSTWYDSSDKLPAYDANLGNTGSKIAKNKVGYVYFKAYVKDGTGEKWYRIPIDTR